MEFVIGIILVLTFFGLAYYCVKGHNLMIGFLIISIVWTALSLLGTLVASPTFIAENPILQFGGDSGTTLVSILNKIYQSAPGGWGTTLVSGQWQGVSLEDYIKACNALQFSQPYAKQTRDNRDDYDGLVRAVKSGEPVIIGTWINGMEGHAVLAYDYKEDSSSFTIYVQDPQCMPYR